MPGISNHNMKLKKNQQKVPGPPPKLSTWTGGPVRISNTVQHCMQCNEKCKTGSLRRHQLHPLPLKGCLYEWYIIGISLIDRKLTFIHRLPINE